jgi:hypothetical protein
LSRTKRRPCGRSCNDKKTKHGRKDKRKRRRKKRRKKKGRMRKEKGLF